MAKLQSNYELVSDKSKNPVVSSEYVKHGTQWLSDAVNSAVTTVNSKADKSYVDAELAKKASKTELAGKADTSTVTALQNTVNSKADASIVAQLQSTVNTKANESTVAAISDRVTTVETDQTALDSRMSAIEAGTTPEGSEVIGIRTAADGKAYPTAGDAVRAQVTDLKSDLSNNNYETIWTDGKYCVAGTGNIADSPSYSVSNRIEISKISNSNIIRVKSDCGSNAGICFYNKNNDFISGVALTSTTGIEVFEVTIPQNATNFIYSCRTVSLSGAHAIMKNTGISDVEKAIIKFENKWCWEIKHGWLDEYYIMHSTGSIAKLATYAVSDAINIPNGVTKVKITSAVASTSVGVAFYTDDFTYISGECTNKSKSTSEVAEVVVNVPTNAKKMIYSTGIDKKSDSNLYFIVDSVEILSEISNSFNSVYDIVPSWIDETYIQYPTGNFVKGLAISASTDFIDMPTGLFSKVIISTCGSQSMAIAFYDKDKFPIEDKVYSLGVVNRELMREFTIDVPENARYIRYTCDINKKSQSTIKAIFGSNGLANTLSNADSDAAGNRELALSLIGRYTAIGDSLTAGHFYKDDGTAWRYTGYNFPSIIGKKANAKTDICAVGGYTAKQLYQEFADLIDYGHTHFYTIWLGTNGGFSVSEYEAIDTSVGWENYPGTDTGYYVKFVDRVIAQSPNAVVVLINIFAGGSGAGHSIGDTQEVIRRTAADRNLLCIETTSYNIDTEPTWHNPVGANVHFSPYGNAKLADEFLDKIGAFINSDPSKISQIYKHQRLYPFDGVNWLGQSTEGLYP